jgi:hypothetical protein
MELFLVALFTLIGFGYAGCFVCWFLVWTGLIKQPRKSRRGFEVKTTPGMTPGLLEKKEDHHG